MSNQIFCNIDDRLCNIIHELAGDRIVIDCGAGRGLFASKYKGKVLSIDIHQPDEPLSFIQDNNSLHYCFPKGSIPVFIRPCHSRFVHETILSNRNKFDKAIYVSMPCNLNNDLETNGLFYECERYSDWEGEEGENIYLVTLKKPKEYFKYLSGKIIYFSDPMLSILVDTQEQEFKISVESPLEDKGILVNGLMLKFRDYYPQGESFDYMFFDWGGMSLGNSMMESLCRHIVREAELYPNRCFVVVSTFTEYAMKDALMELGAKQPNIFTNLNDFANYFLSLENN